MGRQGRPQLEDISATRVLARGRSSVVVDLGDGRVLRRALGGGEVAAEAAVMRWAREHGAPVPEVFDAHGSDLVMEHITGPTLLAELVADPGRAREVGQVLGDLHRCLDGVPAPAGLGVRHSRAPGRALLHGDLHPGNVVMGPQGPVLVDWTNAGAGPRAADVAETWIVLACFAAALDVVPGIAEDAAPTEHYAGGGGGVRAAVLQGLLGRVDRAEAERALPLVAPRRLTDPATSPSEGQRITALVDAHS